MRILKSARFLQHFNLQRSRFHRIYSLSQRKKMVIGGWMLNQQAADFFLSFSSDTHSVFSDTHWVHVYYSPGMHSLSLSNSITDPHKHTHSLSNSLIDTHTHTFSLSHSPFYVTYTLSDMLSSVNFFASNFSLSPRPILFHFLTVSSRGRKRSPV
jgi:hypothetical protein